MIDHRRTSLVVVASLTATAPCFAQSNPYPASSFPATSRKWVGADYASVEKLLSSGKVPLPMFSYPHGSRLLKRMTSTENLEFMTSKLMPLESRSLDFGQMIGSTNSILMLYWRSSISSKQFHGRELAHLMAFTLHLGAAGIDLVDETIPTIPRDSNYAYRMAGVTRVKSGATTVFVGAETSLSEHNHYSEGDLSLFLQAMEETLPTYIRIFKSDYKLELKSKLIKRRSQFKRQDDIKKLESMIRILDS